MPAPLGNKFALGNNGGRPPIYSSAEQMHTRIVEYFEHCNGEVDEETGEVKRAPEPITITGLALFLGFESRQSFFDYEQKQEFSYIVKRARMVVENNYEIGLRFTSPTGAIFALKNMGWVDKNTNEHTGKDGAPLFGKVIHEDGGIAN